MEKKTVSNEGMENTIHSAKQYLGVSPKTQLQAYTLKHIIS